MNNISRPFPSQTTPLPSLRSLHLEVKPRMLLHLRVERDRCALTALHSFDMPASYIVLWRIMYQSTISTGTKATSRDQQLLRFRTFKRGNKKYTRLLCRSHPS